MAIEKAESMSQTSVVICAKFCLIRLRVVQGRLSEALELWNNCSGKLKSSLSQREINILSLVAEGLRKKEMATQLCISDETAKTHLKNIYQKFGASSKVSAIKIAQGRGYLKTDEMH